jgi:hypothetical protein
MLADEAKIFSAISGLRAWIVPARGLGREDVIQRPEFA